MCLDWIKLSMKRFCGEPGQQNNSRSIIQTQKRKSIIIIIIRHGAECVFSTFQACSSSDVHLSFRTGRTAQMNSAPTYCNTATVQLTDHHFIYRNSSFTVCMWLELSSQSENVKSKHYKKTFQTSEMSSIHVELAISMKCSNSDFGLVCFIRAEALHFNQQSSDYYLWTNFWFFYQLYICLVKLIWSWSFHQEKKLIIFI